MTQIEFEAWVSDNYSQLAAAAKRTSRGDDQAIDYLHTILNETVEGRRKMPSSDRDLVAWFAKAVKWERTTEKRAESATRKKVGAYAQSVIALGPDGAAQDTTQQSNILKKRRFRRKVKESGTVESVAKVPGKTRQAKWQKKKRDERVQGLLAGLVAGGTGVTRWLSQQRRDASLYDGEAVRSLSDSIRGFSIRTQRGQGFSFVQFGQEVRMDPREIEEWRIKLHGYDVMAVHILTPEDIGNEQDPNYWWGGPGWTFVSSSTGTEHSAGYGKRFGDEYLGMSSGFDICSGCSEHAISGRHDKACALKKGAA